MAAAAAAVCARVVQLPAATHTHTQTLVAGAPVIDVDRLRANTKYEGFTDDHPVIVKFWNVLASLSEQERSQYATQ